MDKTFMDSFADELENETKVKLTFEQMIEEVPEIKNLAVAISKELSQRICDASAEVEEETKSPEEYNSWFTERKRIFDADINRILKERGYK
jgi:hypothetical protein